MLLCNDFSLCKHLVKKFENVQLWYGIMQKVHFNSFSKHNFFCCLTGSCSFYKARNRKLNSLFLNTMFKKNIFTVMTVL